MLIVADEVHEGNIETEFAIATAAELMTDHATWNMVLMSATLNEQEIQDAYTPINGRPIPSLTVEGRPHAIEQHERPGKSVVDVFAEECLETGRKTLIFTDGKRSIETIVDELNARFGDTVKVLVLHSKIDDAMRQEIFHGTDQPGVHTVIVSTSAGQSGLTIAGLDRVISDGWTKSPELDDENASGLPRRLCSKAELTQQMGRGGRDVAGGKFFLAAPIEMAVKRGMILGNFTPIESDSRDQHIPADIYHTVITRNVLSAAAMERDFYTLNAYLIHKVAHGTIREAYTVLRLMGAVDEDNHATGIGKQMDGYPLRPELARALVEVLTNGTDVQKVQVAAIAASIEAGGLGDEKLEERDKRLSTDTKDDFIAELDLFMGAAKYVFPVFNKVSQMDAATIKVLCHGREIDSTRVFDQKELRSFALPSILVDDAASEGMILHGIDPINAVRAYKQYRKICARSGISSETMEMLTNTFTRGERVALHGFFLKGMPHLIYEEVRRLPNRGPTKRDKHGEKQEKRPFVWFRNILGPEKEHAYPFDRQIGKRSVMAALHLPKDSIVAGYPRWYENHDGATINIIDKGFPTTRSAVRGALGRHALEVRDVTSIGPDGRLQLIRSHYIGRLQTRRSRSPDKAMSPDKASLLVTHTIENPGPALKDIRALKRWLDDLSKRIPRQQQAYYFDKDPLTDHDLKVIVRNAADSAGSVGELDANIRALGITYMDYISSENLRIVQENMPTQIDIGGRPYDIHYSGEEATPTINAFPEVSAGSLPDKLTIRDGREIHFRYKTSQGVYLLKASEVKKMAEQNTV